MKITFAIILLLTCFFLPVNADVLTVINHDFETGGVADGSSNANPGVTPSGWSNVGGTTGIFFGHFNPNDATYVGTTGAGVIGTMSGENVFYYGSLGDGQGIEQTLSDVFAVNTDYDVSVSMGRRRSQLNQDLRIDLFAGSALLATISHDGSTVPFGTFEDRSLSYVFDGADAGLVGSALRIRFTEVDRGNSELDIDNIRVTASSVPEPSTFVGALFGLAVMVSRRRRQV